MIHKLKRHIQKRKQDLDKIQLKISLVRKHQSQQLKESILTINYSFNPTNPTEVK
jgi:hypothetical protein